ncbi:MAG: thiamine pyrophosphate-binding protein [Planctomycetes bacterium]|nr:thiamine pyrophosphate-binding protein [Planctomycetota bacterium]
MAQNHLGANAVSLALVRAGVQRVFTLSGNHVMPLFDAALDAGIELIHTRHEAAAVHMADAWGRLTGEAGVALVSGGPAHANAVSALYTARMSESPVVLLSGHAPIRELGLGAFQQMDQAAMAVPVTKAAWTCMRPDQLGNDVARAVRTAREGRPGPVQVNLPADALTSPAGESTVPGPDAFVPAGMPLDSGTAGEILDRLAAASRPLILTGPTCLTRAGRARMSALEEATGIPVVGMESPRGIDDPSLGAFAEMLARADRVLLVGKRMDFTLRFGRSPAFAADCEFIAVDADAADHERARRTLGNRLVASATADAFAALASFAAPAVGRRRSFDAWRNEVQAAIRYRPGAWDGIAAKAPGRLHPVQACRPLQALLDRHPDSILISDGGEFGQWAQACLSAPHRLINGPAGAIGSALPMALAARIARPDAPVLAFLGDGTFGFHAAEIDTAVRYRLPFVVVVGNDARWNAEYQIQLKTYGPDRLVGCELLPTRYDRVAAAFGGHGEHVETEEALLPAAERASTSGLPACLNVVIEGVPAPVVRKSPAETGTPASESRSSE